MNYNIVHFLFYWRGDQRTRVDSYDTDRKIWNGKTNDFNESCPWIFSLLCKARKENNRYVIHQFIIENVELRLIENGCVCLC